MTIGERVLVLLRERGISQKELSRRTGIPPSTICDWKGKKLNPGSDKILPICAVLGVDPYYLISGTESSVQKQASFLVVGKDSEEYDLLMEYRRKDSDGQKRIVEYAKTIGGDDSKQ